MTHTILKVSDLLRSIKDSRYDVLLLGDLSFTQFDSISLNTNRDITIRSVTKGAVFTDITVSGSETVTFEGVLISKLVVEIGSTVNLIDCDVEILEVYGSAGITKTSLNSLDVRGTVHAVEAKISGFTCIRDGGRATFIRCELTADSLVTVRGSKTQFTNCRINREVDRESLIGWVLSKLPKYFVPKVELAPAKYVGCKMNFRVK